MKDNQLLMMVLRKPLTYPYFDINALRCVEPAETRYKAAVVELDSEEACVLGLPRDHVPEIVLAQYQAGKYLAKRLEEMSSELYAVRQKKSSRKETYCHLPQCV